MKIRTPRLAALSAALLITCDPAVRAANVIVRVQPGPISQTRAVPVTPGLTGLAPLAAPASTLKLTGSVVPGAPAVLSAPRVTGVVSAQAADASAVAAPQAAAAAVVAAPQAQAAEASAQAIAAPVAEASASAEAQAPVLRASTSKKAGVFTRLKEAILNKLDPSRMFDSNRGAAPGAVARLTDSPLKTPQLPAGVVLDDAPISPDPKQAGGVAINALSIPGSRDVGGIFEAGPVVLNADPASEASVKEALLKMVEADPAKYGVTRDELSTVHVKLVQGVGNQADSIFAYFRQTKDGVPVHGAYLSFTVKVIQGRPVVMGAMARLYPNTPVETAPRFSDDELAGRVWQRIGVPPQADVQLTFIERKIIYSRGAWHTANLYMVEGLPVMIAVDVVTGEAFAWDPRMGAATETETQVGAGAQVLGRNIEKGPMKPNSTMVEVPLPNLNITVDGKTYTTDSQGKINANVAKETQVTVTLSGKWVNIIDRSGKTLKVTATLKPGEEAKLVFNAGSTMNEEMTAQVNTYFLVNQLHDWLRANGITDARLDKSIPSVVNIDDECNAYYTPGRPSLNFFRSSANCVNSAYDTVVSHEYGHFVDDMLGGIVDGGLSEGWGDILSMYILNNPIIGEGFLKKPRGGVDYIRHGENTRKYNQYDEVHDLGEVWGGFGWKLRKMLMASLGEAGDAVARSIVLPTLFAKAANIPAAMAQVLLNDVDKDGFIPHEKEIRAAAKIHGVDLPQNPGKLQQFISWLTKPSMWFGGRQSPDQKLSSRLKAASRNGAVDVVISVKGGPKAVAAVSAYLLARGADPKAIEGIGLVSVSGLSADQVRGLAGLDEVRALDVSL